MNIVSVVFVVASFFSFFFFLRVIVATSLSLSLCFFVSSQRYNLNSRRGARTKQRVFTIVHDDNLEWTRNSTYFLRFFFYRFKLGFIAIRRIDHSIPENRTRVVEKKVIIISLQLYQLVGQQLLGT